MNAHHNAWQMLRQHSHTRRPKKNRRKGSSRAHKAYRRQNSNKEPYASLPSSFIPRQNYSNFHDANCIKTLPQHAPLYSMSSTSFPGLFGSNHATFLWSPPLAPTVTQTCLYGTLTPTRSLGPIHLSLPSTSIRLLPRPPLSTHSLTTLTMNSILERK